MDFLPSELDPEHAPFMQVLRLRIDGVEYDFFGPELSGKGEIVELAEVAFIDTIPLPAVMLMLTAAWISYNSEEKNKLQ